MADILGGNVAPVQPPPRVTTGVGGLLGGTAEPQPNRPLRIPAGAHPRASDMDQLMHGISAVEVSRREYNHKNRSGSSVMSALRPDDSEEAEVGDPFAHMRMRPKAIGGVAAQPQAVQPTGNDPRSNDPVFAQLSAVHAELVRAAASAPRDASGAICEYSALLQLLQSRGLPLGADSAGTLLAHLDVNGTISFDDFMEVLASGMAPASEAAPAPAPSYRSQPPAREPIVVRANQPPALGYGGMKEIRMPAAPEPVRTDVGALLGGRKVATAATSAEIAALINPGVNQHARRSDLSMTQGKGMQFR